MNADRPSTAGQPSDVSWARFKDLWDRQQHHQQIRRKRSTTIAVVLWLGALAAILVAWSGAASRATVAEQFPYFISGGLTGIALTIMGAAVLISGALTRDPHPSLDDDRGVPIPSPSTNSGRKIAGPVS